jgi:hypothetical protein
MYPRGVFYGTILIVHIKKSYGAKSTAETLVMVG